MKLDVARRGWIASSTSRGASEESRASQPSQSRAVRARARSRRCAPAAPDAAPGRGRRDDAWRRRTGAGIALRYPAHDGDRLVHRRRRRRRRSRGRRALHRALRGARPARGVALVSRDAARARPRATGRRAAWRPRWPWTTHPSSTCATPRSPAAAPCAASAARVLVDEAPRHGPRPDRARRALRRRPPTAGSSLGLEGGHTRRRVVHAGGSATGRRIVRELSALAVEHPRIIVLERARARRAARRPRAAVVGVVLEDGRAVLPRANDARHRRRGGALVAHDEPARVARDRPRCSRTPPAPTSPTSSSCSSTPPRSSASRAARGSWSPRRSAARAPRCTVPTASASSRSSHRATRSRGPSSPS